MLEPDVTDASAPPRATLPARLRVRRAGLFQEAYAQGQKTVGRYFVLWSRSGEGENRRLGVVASRKVGNSVARSRAKRLLRELFRTQRIRIAGEADVILVARRAILNSTPAERLADFENVFSRAQRLQSPSDCRTNAADFSETPLDCP